MTRHAVISKNLTECAACGAHVIHRRGPIHFRTAVCAVRQVAQAYAAAGWERAGSLAVTLRLAGFEIHYAPVTEMVLSRAEAGDFWLSPDPKAKYVRVPSHGPWAAGEAVRVAESLAGRLGGTTELRYAFLRRCAEDPDTLASADAVYRLAGRAAVLEMAWRYMDAQYTKRGKRGSSDRRSRLQNRKRSMKTKTKAPKATGGKLDQIRRMREDSAAGAHAPPKDPKAKRAAAAAYFRDAHDKTGDLPTGMLATDEPVDDALGFGSNPVRVHPDDPQPPATPRSKKAPAKKAAKPKKPTKPKKKTKLVKVEK